MLKKGYGYKYVNGNYLVIFNNGDLKKIAFRLGEDLAANFPDSIDLKISNRCSRGCPFCHESSVKDGAILDIGKTIEHLSQLPELPIEIAIGGGNILESVPETNTIVDWLISRGHRVRCTIKYEDLLTLTEEQRVLLRKFEGIGLSITNLDEKLKIILKVNGEDCYGSNIHKYFYSLLMGSKNPEELEQDYLSRVVRDQPCPEFVIHIIAGVFPVKYLKCLLTYSTVPVLILGYKQWGRALNNELPESIGEYEQIIKQNIYEELRSFGRHYRKTLVFDNLALEQLHIKGAFTKDEWEVLYMGDEGSHSMYIDAVTGQYARNSRSPERVSWDETGLIEYFKSLRNDSGNN